MRVEFSLASWDWLSTSAFSTSPLRHLAAGSFSVGHLECEKTQSRVVFDVTSNYARYVSAPVLLLHRFHSLLGLRPVIRSLLSLACGRGDYLSVRFLTLGERLVRIVRKMCLVVPGGFRLRCKHLGGGLYKAALGVRLAGITAPVARLIVQLLADDTYAVLTTALVNEYPMVHSLAEAERLLGVPLSHDVSESMESEGIDPERGTSQGRQWSQSDFFDLVMAYEYERLPMEPNSAPYVPRGFYSQVEVRGWLRAAGCSPIMPQFLAEGTAGVVLRGRGLRVCTGMPPRCPHLAYQDVPTVVEGRADTLWSVFWKLSDYSAATSYEQSLRELSDFLGRLVVELLAGGTGEIGLTSGSTGITITFLGSSVKGWLHR